MTTRPRRQDRTLPLVLVALGLLILIANLANVGWLRPDALLSLVQFWPLVPVAAGVDLLLRGRYRALVVLGAVLVAAALYAAGGVLPGAVARTETVAQGLEGARQAEVVLQVGVSDLHLDTTGGDGTALLEGTVQMARGERLTRLFREAGGTAAFELRSTSRGAVGRSSGRRTWDLSLGAAVPTALTVTTGVGRADLELTGARLSRLELRAGVGDVAVRLPRRGRYAARLTGGVGSVTVAVPTGVAVRLELTGGVGAATAPGFDLEGDRYVSDGYLSADYETAANRVDLWVRGVGGAVTVTRGR